MFITRDLTRPVKIKDIVIGGGNPIAIQSMTNTKTEDVDATIKQIIELEEAGCDIVRVAVPNGNAAQAIKQIVKNINIPLVADIHFDYKLALMAIENGVNKLRINPGNIGSEDRVRAVVEKAKAYNVPIRIGVNSGSISQENLKKYGGVNAKSMVESASEHIRILEELNFKDIIVSLKASNVPLAIETYKTFASTYDYPLHVGITEAGTLYRGTIKSSVGLGAILSNGIGDTIRVSLSDHPVKEIECAQNVLQSLNLGVYGVEIISCPTCGRTEVPLIEIANKVDVATKNLKKPLKIAVMGCAVNGPGEAKEADIGIAGGKGQGLIFKKGKIVKKVAADKMFEALMEEIDDM